MIRRSAVTIALAVILALPGRLFAWDTGTDTVKKKKARITAVKGSVEVKSPANKSEWVPGAVNAAVKDGYIIRTGEDSAATLNINGTGESIIVELDARTKFSIVELDGTAGGKNSTLLSLAEGKIAARAKNMLPGSVFEIKTPTSIVSSQGPNSSFNVQVDRID
jgi:hypothetical protein